MIVELLRVRTVDLGLVRNSTHMDALARTLLRGVGDIPQKRQGYGRCGTRGLQQLVIGALHISQSVDVQLEDLGCILGADAVAGTEVLIDPDLQGLAADAGMLLHAHVSCRFLCRAIRDERQVGPALTGVERLEPTTVRFPMLLGGYSPGVRESARVKIGHTPTVFVI